MLEGAAAARAAGVYSIIKSTPQTTLEAMDQAWGAKEKLAAANQATQTALFVRVIQLRDRCDK